MMTWTCYHRNAMDYLGYIPAFLHEADARPAREQLHEAYAHGGGWSPLEGWSFDGQSITYPGDPPLKPIAETSLRDERIIVYPHAWVTVVQKDGSFEVARMD